MIGAVPFEELQSLISLFQYSYPLCIIITILDPTLLSLVVSLYLP